MKISVIIPTYNSENTLKYTLNSLIDEDENFEVVIIDGASTDNTKEIIVEYEEKFKMRNINYKYISEKDLGIYDAMNKGVKISTGKWLYFLGSDDLVVKNSLKKMGDFLLDETVIYYGDCYFYKQHKIYNGEFSKYKITRGNICHQAIFYPRKVFLDVGLYDLKYKLWADYDFNIKCFIKKYKFEYKKILIALYNDETGASANNIDSLFLKDYKLKIKQLGRAVYCYDNIFKILSKIKKMILKVLK